MSHIFQLVQHQVVEDNCFAPVFA